MFSRLHRLAWVVGTVLFATLLNACNAATTPPAPPVTVNGTTSAHEVVSKFILDGRSVPDPLQVNLYGFAGDPPQDTLEEALLPISVQPVVVPFGQLDPAIQALPLAQRALAYFAAAYSYNADDRKPVNLLPTRFLVANKPPGVTVDSEVIDDGKLLTAYDMSGLYLEERDGNVGAALVQAWDRDNAVTASLPSGQYADIDGVSYYRQHVAAYYIHPDRSHFIWSARPIKADCSREQSSGVISPNCIYGVPSAHTSYRGENYIILVGRLHMVEYLFTVDGQDYSWMSYTTSLLDDDKSTLKALQAYDWTASAPGTPLGVRDILAWTGVLVA